MKEIKFKVWDDIDKKWLTDNNIAIGTNGMLWLKEDYDEYHFTNDFRTYKIVFYTGLKDKNGKEIHEGDIIKHVNANRFENEAGGEHYDSHCIIGEVKIKNGCWGIYRNQSRQTDLYSLGNSGYCKIIGNIYENPELLK